MINNTAKERKNGQMVQSTKETTSLVKKMALAGSYGLINHCTKVTLLIIIFMDTANTNGPMEENSPENGI